MKQKTLFRWCCLTTGIAAITWIGCATSSSTRTAGTPSQYGGTNQTVATPSQLVDPTVPAAPPAGYSTEFAATPNQQQLQSSAFCTSGFS